MSGQIKKDQRNFEWNEAVQIRRGKNGKCMVLFPMKILKVSLWWNKDHMYINKDPDGYPSI